MAQWTDPSRTFLIQEIRSRRVLWDKDASSDSNAKAAKTQAFNDVTTLMNDAFPGTNKYTCEDVRSQWKNLKDTFVRKLRYINEGKYAYDTQKEPTWKFYKPLSFLDDTKKKGETNGADHPIFDIAALQRDHGLDLVKSENIFEHSNQSASSTEEQMLSLFAQVGSQAYKEKTPVPPESPPSPSVPRVSQVTPMREPASTSRGISGGSGDDDEEPRRKKICHRRTLFSSPGQDEFELFGQLIAAQLKRTADEHSRADALRLQKRLNDVLFEEQMALLGRR